MEESENKYGSEQGLEFGEAPTPIRPLVLVLEDTIVNHFLSHAATYYLPTSPPFSCRR
jgi:hypothetical protein